MWPDGGCHIQDANASEAASSAELEVQYFMFCGICRSCGRAAWNHISFSVGSWGSGLLGLFFGCVGVDALWGGYGTAHHLRASLLGWECRSKVSVFHSLIIY